MTITKSTLNNFISHIRNREFMSGIQREHHRIKMTGEVFTPTSRVEKELDKLEYYQPDIFKDPKYTFLDDHAGDGQWLGEVLIRKLSNGIDLSSALEKIYGVEFEGDNCELLKQRLLCNSKDPKHLEIINKNIVCADALRYHYRFDGSYPYDEELKEKQFNERFDSFFQ